MILSLLVSLLSVAGISEPTPSLPVRPAPRITGRVIALDGKPIAGAQLTTASTLFATTDRKGQFSFPFPETAPELFFVEAKSYATRPIAFPQSAAVANLGDIVLLRAASVTVDLSRVRGAREVSLVRNEERRNPQRAITKRARRRVTFDNLEKGDYMLTVRGGGPLQQKSQLVQLAESEAETVTVQIDRMPLHGYVFLGREPLAHADLTIAGPTAAWAGRLRTDADGFFAAELWQVGPMKAAVRTPKLDQAFTSGTRATDALERGFVEWNIAISDRKVTGRVVDDAGAAVANATVTVETEDGELRSSFTAATDAEGMFRFTAARSGRYALDIHSPHHLRLRTTRFELRDDDPDRRVDLVLERGAEVLVRVQREDGTPIAGVTIASDLDENGAKALLRMRTSPAGEARFRGRAGEEKTLYVIPPDGSFAVARVTLDAETLKHGIDVHVPEAKSALVIRTRDERGAALDGIGFVVRYNGELLPPAVLSLIRFVQHVDYRTTPAGEARIHGLPSGQYELWAYRTAHEQERLVLNPERYRPVLELAIAQGTYEADLTFGK